MKTPVIALVSMVAGICTLISFAETPAEVTAPAAGSTCDSAAFLKAAAEAESLRAARRVTAEDFARMAKEPGAIVLDARGKADYDALRIKGSVSLPYTSMAADSLRHIIPNPKTRILIYCRNNLIDTRPAAVPAAKPAGLKEAPYPDEFEPPLIPKAFAAGLNIPTYITLHIYGYRNVWELDPAIDPNRSVIEFESGSSVQ